MRVSNARNTEGVRDRDWLGNWSGARSTAA